jgi:hypothetical protein
MVVAILKGQWPYVTPQNFAGGPDAAAQINDAAFDAMIATGLPMIVPAADGPYRISKPVNLKGGNSSLLGAGRLRSRISQTANNLPIVEVGRAKSRLSFLGLEYARQQQAPESGSIALSLHKPYLSRFEELSIVKAQTGIGIPQIDVRIAEDGLEGGNYQFNNSFLGIEVLFWTHTGIDNRAYRSEQTGSAWLNTRLQNSAIKPLTQDCVYGLRLEACGSEHFITTNFENMCAAGQIAAIGGNSSASFDGVHFEGINPGFHQFKWVQNEDGSLLTMNNVTVRNSLADGIMFASSTSRTCISGFDVKDLGLVPDHKMRLFSGNRNSEVRLINVKAGSEPSYCIDSRVGLVEFNKMRFDAEQLVLGLSGRGPPSSGGMPVPFMDVSSKALPWQRGDFLREIETMAGGLTGYHCVESGWPGVWKGAGRLEF